MALEAENNYYNARVDLNNSMYLDSQPDYKIKNTPTFDFDNDYAYSVAVRELKPYENILFRSQEKTLCSWLMITVLI